MMVSKNTFNETMNMHADFMKKREMRAKALYNELIVDYGSIVAENAVNEYLSHTAKDIAEIESLLQKMEVEGA